MTVNFEPFVLARLILYCIGHVILFGQNGNTPERALGMVGEITARVLSDELKWQVIGFYQSYYYAYGRNRGPGGTHAGTVLL